MGSGFIWIGTSNYGIEGPRSKWNSKLEIVQKAQKWTKTHVLYSTKCQKKLNFLLLIERFLHPVLQYYNICSKCAPCKRLKTCIISFIQEGCTVLVLLVKRVNSHPVWWDVREILDTSIKMEGCSTTGAVTGKSRDLDIESTWTTFSRYSADIIVLNVCTYTMY
jgi:hypothetical protein